MPAISLRAGLAVSLLNRSPTAQNITAEWSALGLEAGERRSVRDVWAGAEAGEAAGSYSAEVAAWGVALLVLS